MTDDRIAAVTSLLEFSEPLEQLAERMSEFDWDCTGQPVVLMPEHVVEVLERFLSDQIPASIVERWANLVEGRDDVDFQYRDGLMSVVVHELANPTLTLPLDRARAALLVERLKLNITAYDYDDTVTAKSDAPSELRPGETASVVAILPESERRGDFLKEFPDGTVYIIEFNDGSTANARESDLIFKPGHER